MRAAAELGDHDRFVAPERAELLGVGRRVALEAVEVHAHDVEARPVHLLPERGGVRQRPVELPAREPRRLVEQGVELAGHARLQPRHEAQQLQSHQRVRSGDQPVGEQRVLAAGHERHAAVARADGLGGGRGAAEMLEHQALRLVGQARLEPHLEPEFARGPRGHPQPPDVRAVQQHRRAVQLVADDREVTPHVTAVIDGVGDPPSFMPAPPPRSTGRLRRR